MLTHCLSPCCLDTRYFFVVSQSFQFQNKTVAGYILPNAAHSQTTTVRQRTRREFHPRAFANQPHWWEPSFDACASSMDYTNTTRATPRILAAAPSETMHSLTGATRCMICTVHLCALKLYGRQSGATVYASLLNGSSRFLLCNGAQ